MDGLVKIGDFGLVTTIVDEEIEEHQDQQFKMMNSKLRKHHHHHHHDNPKHTNCVGTQLYMSPEQVSGKEKKSFTIKMFNLFRLKINHMIIKWIFFQWESFYTNY